MYEETGPPEPDAGGDHVKVTVAISLFCLSVNYVQSVAFYVMLKILVKVVCVPRVTLRVKPAIAGGTIAADIKASAPPNVVGSPFHWYIKN